MDAGEGARGACRRPDVDPGGVGAADRVRDGFRDYHALMGRPGIESEFIAVDGVGHNDRQFYTLLGGRVWEF